LARFNVSNEHGEQHHFSFLGLPSPGAGGTVAAWVLMQQDMLHEWAERAAAKPPLPHLTLEILSQICTYALPLIVLATGLLMVSNIRYPHVVNQYLRGRRPLTRLVLVVVLLLALVVSHQYTLGIGMLVYAFYGFVSWAMRQVRKGHPPGLPSSPAST
jgi:phosphatidylserine synthase